MKFPENIPAWALTGVLALTLLSGCGSGGSQQEPPSSDSASAAQPDTSSIQAPSSSSPDETNEPVENFSFHDLKNLEFVFSSGVGAWSTLLHVRADGSFSGTYYDSDMTTQYRCDFSGQFTEPVKVNDDTYSVTIAQIDYQNQVGAEETKDGIHYIYSEPYGLDGAEELLIYLPGAPIAELPEDFVNWVAHSILGPDGLSDLSQVTELPFYGLYNETQLLGFSSYDLVEGLQTRLAATQEQSDTLEQSILEDNTMSQGDLNSAYGEMDQLWDSQLNDVWQVLTKLLDPEEMDSLTQEELEWIAWKDNEAAHAGEEYDGGSLQIMAQAQRSAEVTRERVYELMEYLDE